MIFFWQYVFDPFLTNLEKERARPASKSKCMTAVVGYQWAWWQTRQAIREWGRGWGGLVVILPSRLRSCFWRLKVQDSRKRKQDHSDACQERGTPRRVEAPHLRRCIPQKKKTGF